MKKTPWYKLSFLILALCLVSACKQENIVHQKSLAELNTKAQQMLQAGDVNGAVARLEAAHDLAPEEPNTTFNLAIAYQTQGNYDKAIELFQQLLKQPGFPPEEIHRNLGITYEAKADALEVKARELEAEPRAEQPQPAELRQQAIGMYQLALSAYRASLSGDGKAAAETQRQIAAIEAKLRQLNGNNP